ncbi:hypothetical protein HYALB_00009587 [Hymenoscyphus albidus]|uniref:Uncharacterized protein n=1 Tax=Hymenoscyphus albidus TaxID=595503 RepID=A0A9N9Q8K8_9HELO|nr:hypothetical protein HYALB_00009587 [Hymenoscyphus albidus]
MPACAMLYGRLQSASSAFSTASDWRESGRRADALQMAVGPWLLFPSKAFGCQGIIEPNPILASLGRPDQASVGRGRISSRIQASAALGSAPVLLFMISNNHVDESLRTPSASSLPFAFACLSAPQPAPQPAGPSLNDACSLS